MPELTLKQLFGDNSAQDDYLLIIQKADLKLTAKVNNSAESLLVAILLKVVENFRGNLTDAQGSEITDNQGKALNYDNSSIYDSLNIEAWAGFFKQRNDLIYATNTFVIHQFTLNAD